MHEDSKSMALGMRGGYTYRLHVSKEFADSLAVGLKSTWRHIMQDMGRRSRTPWAKDCCGD